jgi:hypothetical protein
MSHEKLKVLIERARQENKVLYCAGNNQYYTPADMDNLNSEGKCLWAVEHFELVDYNQLITSKYEKPLKFEAKGIIYLPVTDTGNTRVMTEEISFWYYDKKAMQTMVHLKSGDCLRVEQDIETVDQKILDSKVPAIGRELAEFWEDIIVNGIHHNGKGKRYDRE